MGASSTSSRRDISEGMARLFDRFPILDERRYQWPGASGGEQQMLASAGALMARHGCWCSMNLHGTGAAVVKEIFKIIQELKPGG